MIERLSGDFIRGYTRAIQDVIDIFEYIEPDLKHHRKGMTRKLAIELLKVVLAERESIREQRSGFIRWNNTLKKFEFFNGKEEKREDDLQ